MAAASGARRGCDGPVLQARTTQAALARSPVLLSRNACVMTRPGPTGRRRRLRSPICMAHLKGCALGCRDTLPSQVSEKAPKFDILEFLFSNLDLFFIKSDCSAISRFRRAMAPAWGREPIAMPSSGSALSRCPNARSEHTYWRSRACCLEACMHIHLQAGTGAGPLGPGHWHYRYPWLASTALMLRS